MYIYGGVSLITYGKGSTTKAMEKGMEITCPATYGKGYGKRYEKRYGKTYKNTMEKPMEKNDESPDLPRASCVINCTQAPKQTPPSPTCNSEQVQGSKAAK